MLPTGGTWAPLHCALGHVLLKCLENAWLFLTCLSTLSLFMETVTFTVSAVWNTAFAIALNDYLLLLNKTLGDLGKAIA